MARIKEIPGLEVEILVNGKPVKEVLKIEQENLTVVRIQAVPGCEFAIRTRLQSPFEIGNAAISFKVQVDGVKVLGRVFRRKQYEKLGMIEEKVIEGVFEGTVEGLVLRPFKFVQPLENNTNTPNPLPTSAGKIIVHAWEAKAEGIAEHVPEQDLVEGALAVSHGDPKLVKDKIVYRMKSVNKKPMASFVFEYESGPLPPASTPKNKLYDKPLFTPESFTGPVTPGSSVRKRVPDFIILDEETPSKRRTKPSTQTKNNQGTVEDKDGDDNHTASISPIRRLSFHKTTSNQKTSAEEERKDDGDSSTTLSASSPTPPNSTPKVATLATPVKTTTVVAKSTPKTPTSGLKLKPRNTPQKPPTETIDLTGDSD